MSCSGRGWGVDESPPGREVNRQWLEQMKARFPRDAKVVLMCSDGTPQRAALRPSDEPAPPIPFGMEWLFENPRSCAVSATCRCRAFGIWKHIPPEPKTGSLAAPGNVVLLRRWLAFPSAWSLSQVF